MFREKGIDKKVSCKTISAQRADAIEQGDEALAELLDRETQTHLGPVLTYKTKKEIAKGEKENKSNMQNLCSVLIRAIDLFYLLLIVLPLYPKSMKEKLMIQTLTSCIKIGF